MNIYKAIKKQNKSYNRFALFMCFVFFALPVLLVINKKIMPFYIAYLLVIELLIMISMIISLKRERLVFEYKAGKFKLYYGLVLEPLKIICNKVLYVDIELSENYINKFQDFKILIVSNSRFKSNKMKSINYEFMRKHTLAAEQYRKLKERNPEDEYYYVIINSGGLKKYSLLNTIYKSCVHAGYSEDAIEKIKLYRDSEY